MAWEARVKFLNDTNPFAAKPAADKPKLSVAERLKEALRGVRKKS